MASGLIVFGVTGARSWENEDIPRGDVRTLVTNYGTARLLCVCGGAAGLDTIFERVAKEEGVHCARVDALWDTYHRAAGPIRNGMMQAIVMAMGGQFVLAYHWDLKESKGTADMVKRCRRGGLDVKYRKVPKYVAMPSLDTSDLKEAKAARTEAKKEKRAKARRKRAE